MSKTRKAVGLMAAFRFAAAALMTIPLGVGSVWAGAISTPNLSSVYSNLPTAGGGTVSITINWLTPGTTIVNPALATINDSSSFLNLFAKAPDNPVTGIVDAFFVDAINVCGSLTGSNIVGCSDLGGHKLMVQSSFAATADGFKVLAHELGHNLGLDHVSTSSNLMYPDVGSIALTSDQVSTILASNLVQGTGNNLFIQIRPIAVLSAVAEPEMHLLLMAGLLVVFAARRRALL